MAQRYVKVESLSAERGKNFEQTFMKADEKYMARCIQLARNGEAGAAPNPMVGAVIVADGRIIGEGWHRRCGGPHAEVNAIGSVAESDRPLLHRATIYVSLEPCSHWGKTPPCADLIISTGIPRVVCGCQDPFAQVQGRGIQRLRDAGEGDLFLVLLFVVFRRFQVDHTDHQSVVFDKTYRPVLKFACRIGFRMDIGNFLHLKRAFKTYCVIKTSSDIEDIVGI